jgi:peptidoglycan/xylan/chitin deacetylase (PgdA/CDA1 family)
VKKFVPSLVICLLSIVLFTTIVQINHYKSENTNLLQELVNKKLQNETKLQEIESKTNQLQQDFDNLSKDKTQLEEDNTKLKNELETLNKKLLSQAATNKNVVASTKTPSTPSVTNGEKVAYLTFDDGPSVNTPKILEILDKYKIHGTFFVIANQTDFGSQMYHHIIDSGNAIGNHTYTHDYNKIYQSYESFKQDFDDLQGLLQKTIGVQPKIMRFPGGSNNHVSWNAGGKLVMNDITSKITKDGYTYFDWNIDSGDADKVTNAKSVIVHNVLTQSLKQNNIIVLMHDAKVKTTTVEGLPEIIEGLQKQGFTFKTLNENSFNHQFLKPQ